MGVFSTWRLSYISDKGYLTPMPSKYMYGSLGVVDLGLRSVDVFCDASVIATIAILASGVKVLPPSQRLHIGTAFDVGDGAKGSDCCTEVPRSS